MKNIYIARAGLVTITLFSCIVGLTLFPTRGKVPLVESEPVYADEAPVKAGSPLPWISIPNVLPVPIPVSPGGIPVLDGEIMYVISSSVECFAMTSPGGTLSVTQEVGPVRIRGKFVGGGGIETKLFQGKAVIIVTAQATGRAEIFVTKVGAQGPADVFRQIIDANQGPLPPPIPVPPIPVPPTPVPPAPVPVTGFRVIIVQETGGNMPSFIYSKKITDYLNRKCTDGPKGWRRFDKDTNLDQHEPKLWLDLWAKTKPEIKSVPSIVIVVNEVGTVYPMTSEQATLDLLAKIAGP